MNVLGNTIKRVRGVRWESLHNLFYTLCVYILYNKIRSNKIHVIAEALNFTNKC